jgi:hypothetical protein
LLPNLGAVCWNEPPNAAVCGTGPDPERTVRSPAKREARLLEDMVIVEKERFEG